MTKKEAPRAQLSLETPLLVLLVETGESRTPRPEETIDRIYYKLIRLFVPRPFKVPPTKPLRGQPVFLKPPLPASGGPHPRFMAPSLPDSGNTGE